MRLGALLAVLLISAGIPATAQRTATDSLSERYERARRGLEEQRAAAAKTEAERNRLMREAQALRAKLIANADRVQALEAELAQIEPEIERLQAQAMAMEARFARDREPVGHLLAVLQRLDRDAPPALALRPDDALAAARGAMMLGAMLPPLYRRAAELSRQLERLRATLDALKGKRKQARATGAALIDARAQLSVLMEQRGRETEAAESRLGAIRALANEMARNAGDLRGLIERIERLRTKSGRRMTIISAESVNPAALRRGHLRRPVVGRMTPGGPDAPGPVTSEGGGISGVWFAASGGAQAVAPADGEVVFAGPYQKFGQVLILELAGGYDLVLAGLGRIDVGIGDSVLAGEPVGVLPLAKQAHLYLELRRGGKILNPAAWLTDEARKARRS
jgi:septal ring factor EnvC (AmiA/AmiB activator)